MTKKKWGEGNLGKVGAYKGEKGGKKHPFNWGGTAISIKGGRDLPLKGVGEETESDSTPQKGKRGLSCAKKHEK